MIRQTLTVAALLLCAFSTARAGSQLEVAEQAAEIGLSQVQMPTNEFGTVKFSLCDTCTEQTARLSSGTRFVVNGRVLSFVDFEAALTRVRESTTATESALVGLYFDAATKRLTSIVVAARF